MPPTLPNIDPDLLDSDVPELAVKGLNEASRRAKAAGHTIVVVRDGRLIRESPDGKVEVLKQLPPRPKAADLLRMIKP